MVAVFVLINGCVTDNVRDAIETGSDYLYEKQTIVRHKVGGEVYEVPSQI
jgi:hypothetical protein